MTSLRLVEASGSADLTRADLIDLYSYPDPLPASGWVRANLVTSLDGAVAGADGRSAGLSGAADKAVFGVLRSLADVIVVGAGTARAEGYRRPAPARMGLSERSARGQSPAPALAVVSRSADVAEVLERPPELDDPTRDLTPDDLGEALLLTCSYPGDVALQQVRDAWGEQNVFISPGETVDLVAATQWLAERGLRRILSEGGPRLLGDLQAAGRLDEVCLTWSPMLDGAGGPGVLGHRGGPSSPVPLSLGHLLTAPDGWLLGRWLVSGASN